MKKAILFCSAAFLAVSGLSLKADVKMPSVFSNNMVLQSGVPLNVWGKAEAGENIIVSFKGQQKKTVAASDGKWTVRLDAVKESAEAAEMKIKGKNEITISNVIVGDVWMASGQSNMEMRVKSCLNFEEEKKNANIPAIRYFNVEKQIAPEPLDDLKGKWIVCSPETVGDCSAVAFFFGRALYLKYKTPLGFINNSWGGSACQAWTPAETLKADKSLPQPLNIPAEKLADMKTYSQYAESIYQESINKDPGISPEAAKYAADDFDDRSWKDINIPSNIENTGANIDGAIWFRREIEIPESWKDSELTLVMFACDNDVTYFNGTKVGESVRKSYLNQTPNRYYKVSKDLVKPGKNEIAIRVFNTINNGGLTGANPPDLRIQKDNNNKISLSGKWKYNIELKLPPAKLSAYLPSPKDIPAGPYNAMVAPHEDYQITGVIWYQGESNAGAAMQYRKLFSDMIKSWRVKFKNPEMPFLFVQLANWRDKQKAPSEGSWAEIRESQTLTLKVPRTGMAVTSDIGEALDIHPKNKQDVGLRLARWAELYRYGNKDIEVSGPLYDSVKFADGKAEISFTHTKGGLKSKDGELKGFAIAGTDKNFVWAKAEIKGDKIIVWSDAVKEPAAVRYAWAINPEGNLYNGEGLPASGFRTDIP